MGCGKGFTRCSHARIALLPRLDVAAGPFNIDLKRGPNAERINSTYNKQKNLLKQLRSSAAYCGTNLDSNANPRCFLAIEIEGRSGTRKQRLGSILNASAIGKIGIAVGWDAEVTDSLRKIQQYLDFLWDRQKTAWRPQNVIIMERLTFLSGLASPKSVR